MANEKYVMMSNNPTGAGSFSLNRKSGTTVGDYSYAEGSNTTASGEASHAEGSYTTASGRYSHTEGYRTTASGSCSHAEGYLTIAEGKDSLAAGAGTVASADYSTAIGIGNDPQPDDLFEIGNGSVFDAQGNLLPEESRTKSNALRVTKDGRVIVKTDVELENGTKLSDREAVSNKVTSIGDNPTDIEYPSAKAVKDYVDGGSSAGIGALESRVQTIEDDYVKQKDIPTTLPASDVYDWAKASTKPSYGWTEITNKPSTFTPSSHTHPWSNLYNIPNLVYTLSGAANIREISIQTNASASKYMQVVTGSSVAYGVNVWESDTKLKKNIAPTDQTALDKVKQIDFVQFDWKDTDKHVDLGVTANQLETVIPSAVYDVPQGEESEFDSLKNIDTGIMATYALKAIQELSNIIEKQQQEINTLKEKIKYNE